MRTVLPYCKLIKQLRVEVSVTRSADRVRHRMLTTSQYTVQIPYKFIACLPTTTTTNSWEQKEEERVHFLQHTKLSGTVIIQENITHHLQSKS